MIGGRTFWAKCAMVNHGAACFVMNGGSVISKLVVATIGAIWAVVVALLALTRGKKDRSLSDSRDSHHTDAGHPNP